MQKSAIALFLGSASALNINGKFSEMPSDSEFIQVTSEAAAKSGSGVRARWVELPDCMHWCNFVDDVTGKAWDPPIDNQPAGLYIPLRDDLANAIIATCKGPEPGYGAAVCIDPVAPTPPGGFVPNPATQIYDPVWKTTAVIPDSEH